MPLDASLICGLYRVSVEGNVGSNPRYRRKPALTGQFSRSVPKNGFPQGRSHRKEIGDGSSTNCKPILCLCTDGFPPQPCVQEAIPPRMNVGSLLANFI
jgi:hypothetical protein